MAVVNSERIRGGMALSNPQMAANALEEVSHLVDDGCRQEEVDPMFGLWRERGGIVRGKEIEESFLQAHNQIGTAITKRASCFTPNYGRFPSLQIPSSRCGLCPRRA